MYAILYAERSYTYVGDSESDGALNNYTRCVFQFTSSYAECTITKPIADWHPGTNVFSIGGE